jgi:hypothetical protein
MKIISGDSQFVYNQLLQEIKKANLSIVVSYEDFLTIIKRSGNLWLMGVKYEPNV